MKILHVCAGWETWNGAANIARMIMDEQRRRGHKVSSAVWARWRELKTADEVWIHCGWLPCLWWAALWGSNIHWMPEACYDPVRLRYHGWKKRLVGPIERHLLRRAAKIVATCEAEKKWIERYVGKKCPSVEITDIKRFFDLNRAERVEGEVLTQRRVTAPCGWTRPVGKRPSRAERVPRDAEHDSELSSSDVVLHVLYLGRRHPLKGVKYLEEAVRQTKNLCASASLREAKPSMELKVVSNAFGEELEKVWQWCDVLVLPTLSENFGLVVAEALERGKRVVTTDGAPAWGDEGRGKREERMALTITAVG